MKKRQKVIIVMPAYNAEKTLESLFERIPKGCYDDIILFDDKSKDNTLKVAKDLDIKAYGNPVNLGYGGNLKIGFDKALNMGADIIVELHPDNEYDPSAITPAIEKVKKGADLVLGNRFFNYLAPIRNGMYIWKYMPIVLLSLLAKYALWVKVNDLHQGFRVFTRKMLQNVRYRDDSNNYLFSFEIIAQARFKNMKIDEVPMVCFYVGKKRGASLKNSIIYTLGTFRIMVLFILAKLGYRTKIFF